MLGRVAPNKVGNVSLPGAAPFTYPKATLHAKNGLIEQYFNSPSLGDFIYLSLARARLYHVLLV